MPADLGLSLPQEESPMSAHFGALPGLSMPADLAVTVGSLGMSWDLGLRLQLWSTSC